MNEAWRQHPVYGPYLARAEGIFRRAWCRETCAPEYRFWWTPTNPAVGQCTVTAMILRAWLKRDFGQETEILVTRVPGLGTHYWNRLADGTEVDLTRGMFEDYVEIPPGRPTDFLKIPDLRRRLPDLFARLDLLTARCEEAAKTL